MRLRNRRRSILAIALLTILALFGFEAYQITTDHPVYASEGDLDQLTEMDCGVVLTGGPGRIREAFEIMGQKKIKKLIISGVYKEAQLSEIFPPLPFYPEINVADVILEKRSESTFGNAVQSLAVVQTLQCKNILLITSQLHMHRAYKIFKTIYPANFPIKKFYVSHLRKDPSEMDLVIETIKSVFYIVFGRVL